MTGKQAGHRAAAWGCPRDAIPGAQPLPSFVAEMYAAFDRAEAHRAKGLDPNGHGPMIPHTCQRTESATEAAKVCNCCGACATACWAEKFEGTQERLKTAARGLLRKILPWK